jgi:hypothetical protein
MLRIPKTIILYKIQINKMVGNPDQANVFFNIFGFKHKNDVLVEFQGQPIFELEIIFREQF